ncbi:MAG: SAM hydroxide adenosyltransferase [Opitutales bacterium]
MARLSVLFLILLSFKSICFGQTHLTGDVDGVDYIINVPAEPTGKVMFLARGYRPDFFPLSAVYEVGTRFYQSMLDDGWTIASTAFRTNAWVVSEGAEDILALQAFIDAEVHPIKQSILYGETMGGGVAVWLAENKPESFAGVLCLGAHLFEAPESPKYSDDSLASVFSANPQIPIVLLANGPEMKSSQVYKNAAKDASTPSISWYVERTGHVNVNSAERLAAMKGLLDWIDGAKIESVENGTLEMSPDSTAALGDSIAAGNIRLLRPLYGNIYTSLVPQDLAHLNISLSDTFELIHRGTSHSVTYAKAYSDVPYGEWVAFIDPEGYVQISRNYANAAETLGAQVGDPFIVRKKGTGSMTEPAP